LSNIGQEQQKHIGDLDRVKEDMQRQENISIKDVEDSVVIQYFIFNNPTEISMGPEFRQTLAFARARLKNPCWSMA